LTDSNQHSSQVAFSTSHLLSHYSQGEKLLVTDKGMAYLASDPLIAIWNSYEGNPTEEVLHEVAAVLGRDKKANYADNLSAQRL